MLVFDINWDCVEELYRAESNLPPRLLFKMMERKQATAQGWENGSTDNILPDAPNKTFIHRMALPAGWFISLGWLTMPFIARKVKHLANKLLGGIPDTVSFISPHYIYLQKALKPKITIYHPIDDYKQYWPKRQKLTESREKAMILKSDLIICAGHYRAQELKQQHPQLCDIIHHIPNPVSADYLVATPLPPTNNERPILGYIGSIDDRLEIRAIVELSKSMPNCDIVLRSDKPQDDPFSECTNVRYHPRVSEEEMPAFIQSFDICLVPQTDSHFNKCSSPRKLYEFLGSSRPIVALNSPEAETLEPYVRNLSAIEEFTTAVKDIIENGEPEEHSSKRLELARDRLPSALADKYAQLLEDTRKRKNLS